ARLHDNVGETAMSFDRDNRNLLNGKGDASVHQALLNLLQEQGVAADFQQATDLDAVPDGDDLDQEDERFALSLGHAQGAADGALQHAGLGQSQARTPGADAQERLSHVETPWRKGGRAANSAR